MIEVLVTGSAGFIGYHTTLRLLQMGYRVTGIDNLNDYYDPDLKFNRLSACGINRQSIGLSKQPVQSSLHPAYRFIRSDITDTEAIQQLFRNNHFDAIIHLAAQPGARYSIDHPDTYIQTNILGFFNILEACRHNPPKHLVYASSSSIYGSNEKIPYSENDQTDAPVSLYGATKKSNELMAHAYSHLYKIPMTGLRFFTVYGPWGRPDMVYFKYTRSILEGNPIDVYNHGKLKRDFTYVDDIVNGILSLIPKAPKMDVPHHVFNIGNSEPVELLQFIETLEAILDKKAVKNMLPMQKGDVFTTYADSSKLEAYCGYKPHTCLEDGLRNFTGWYSNEYLSFK